MASNKSLVPEAKEALSRFKMEAAGEVGVNLKQGYNGDLTAKQAGSVGGQMVNYEPRTNYEIRPPQQNITGTQNNRQLLVFPYRIRHSEHQYIIFNYCLSIKSAVLMNSDFLLFFYHCAKAEKSSRETEGNCGRVG